MHIAIYARKSTESDDRQVQSLEDQLRALKALADRDGCRIAEVIQESRSAKVPGTRPDFEKLIADIEAGKVHGVYTWSINRLSRNLVDGSRIAYLLQTGQLEFIQTIERRYRPEDNALLLSIENGMATAYLQDLSRNVKRGMQGKVDRGWHTCKAPIGYRNDPESREIVLDAVRFPLVRRAWELMLADGSSIAEIHRDMVGRGLTVGTRRGPQRLISRSHMYSVFRDPFYAGKIGFKGALYPGKHTAMVTPAEFESVQRKLNALRSRIDRRFRIHRFPYAGVLRCALCGCSVVAETKQKTYRSSNRIAVYTYYHCSGSKGCPKLSVSEDELRDVFMRTVERIGIQPSTVGWLKDALLASLESDSTTAAVNLADLSRAVAAESSRLKRLTDMRIDGELSSSEFKDLKGETEGKIAQLVKAQEDIADQDQRILQLAYEKLDKAVEAEELTGEDYDPFALGKFMSGVGTCLLNLKKIEIRIDPILQIIAAFEPLRNGSERPKRGDLLPVNSLWWSLVTDIRNSARNEVLERKAKISNL